MIEIDGYAAIERIGHGGLGDVYRATRVSTGGVVAIKVLRDVSDQSVAWHRTRRELTALVSLAGHANVIQLLELLELEQGPALVMEYAPGGSVADLLQRRGGTLSVAETVLVGRHTAAALMAAHAQGIVHRDIKPQNLLIDAYGQVKLCDFGIAALTRSEDFQYRTSALSMRYASPEDLDNHEVGPASDVYSLGATMLHLAHGAPPTLKERLAPWVPPNVDDPHLSALDAVIAGCLQPDPVARPTAAAVRDELERLGWAVDERQRSLVFEPPAIGEPAADARTDPRRPGAAGVAPEASPAGTDPRRHGAAVGPDDATVARRHLDAGALLDDPIADATDATRHHASRVPPRPAATPRRRGPLVIGAVLAAALATAALVWWGGGQEASAPTTTVARPATTPVGATARPTSSTVPPPTTAVTTPVTAQPTTTQPATPPTSSIASTAPYSLTARPTDLPDVQSAVWPFGPVGECLVQRDGEEQLAPVSCERPHDLQRTLAGELDAAAFPADASFAAADVDDAVVTACRAAFEAFTGTALADSPLDTAHTRPSADSWTAGDRRFQCVLFAPGLRIVGDARD